MKKLLLLIFLLLFSYYLTRLSYINKTKLNLQNNNLTSNTASQENNKKIAQERQIYYLDLELFPANNSVYLLQTGKYWAKLPDYQEKMPQKSGDYLIYKVVATTPNNELIFQGWNYVLKKIILTSDFTYIFRAETIYQPKANVKIYLPGDKLIYSTTIP